MNVEDPTLARFLGAFRVDIERNPQLAEALGETGTSSRNFVESLVDVGIATGELDRADRASRDRVAARLPGRPDRRRQQ